jgi:hypothetical protein
MGLNGFILKKIKNHYVKEKKKSWELFRICLLNSTANSAQFGWKWAELAVLFSRQLLNSSHDLFHIFSMIFIYLFKYETIETHARAFLALNIVTVGSVNWMNFRQFSTVLDPSISKMASILQFLSAN